MKIYITIALAIFAMNMANAQEVPIQRYINLQPDM